MADGAGAPSGATMVDAQFSNARILKPFPGFEQVYQGQSALTPISFPGIRDTRATGLQPGYDPNLLAGIPVPMGSRIDLKLPMCFASVPPADPATPFQSYSYRLIWRYQNVRKQGTQNKRPRRQAPFHFPRQVDGAPSAASPRFTLPAAWHVIANEEQEPVTGANNLVVRVETIVPALDQLALFNQPLLPDGKLGVVEQGVLDPTTSVAGPMPIYVPFMTDAFGDELIILVTRTGAVSEDVWDFTSAGASGDLAFSNIFGTGNGAHVSYPAVGIYMHTGTAP